MVRETRYLLVGNIPEKCSEDVVSEYFKRYGKIQSVKLHGKKNATDEIISATVAFIDIRSASKAHNSENRLENNVLNTEYSEGHATGSAVTRTTAPAAPQVRSAYTIPRGSAYSGSSRPKGAEEGEIYESGGSRDYYARGAEASGQFQDNHFQSSFSEGGQYQRGRQKERFGRGNCLKPDRGGLLKQRHSKDGSRLSFEQTSEEKSKSPGHSPSQASSRHSSNRRKKKTSHSRSRSKSRSRSGSSSSSSYSGSSSSSSRSGSHSSKSSSPSSVRKPHIPSSAILEVKSQGSTTSDRTEALGPDGERRPHGIRISNLPLRSSDTSLRDGLFHEYKKYGKVNAVQVSGAGEERYAVVSFRKPEDAEKCVKESQGGKTFFGTKVKVILHDGIDFDDNEFRPPEAELDEYHPKATRTLFVGNLEKEISNQELKERFSKFGDIIDIDVKRQGAVSAYAFVQYSDISSVVKALKGMEGEHMGSMKLKLGFGKSMPTTCIWLDNVAETVTESFVSRQFNRYGNVTSTVIDHIRGKALVYFNSMDSAQFALNEMRNRIFNGKKIMIDFASRECQNGFFDKMEKSGQLKPGQRPDERTRGWQQYNRQTSNDGQWEGGRTFEKRGGFTQYAGRGKWGRGYQKNWSGNFQGRTFSAEEHQARRQRSYDEYSQGGNGDDSFEQDLRDYSYSQQERRERGSVSPGEYSDDMYGDPAYQFTAKDDRPYSERYKDGHYPEGYRSESPGSDGGGGGVKSYSEDRYVYGKSRSDSFFNKERYGNREKVGDQSPDAWSRSPQFREANKDSNYGRNTPPTPVDDEPNDFSSLDHSPMDLESNQRRYGDYKRKVGGKTDDFDITEADIEEIRTSNIMAASSVKHRKESTSQRPQDRFMRKRSYDEFAHDSKMDDSHRLERQTSRTNRDKFAEKRELFQKVKLIQSQIGRCKGNSSGNGNEGSTSSSSSDSERGSMTETELSKLQHEKLSLLEKLKQLEKEGSMSDAESANDLEDSRKVISSKRPRLDPKSPWPPSSVIVEPKKPPHNLFASQSFRKQMEQLRKMEEQSKRDEKQRTVTKENKYDSESEDHLGGCLSPKEIPSEFILKKRKKYDNSDDLGLKSRSYRPKKSEDDDHRSSELDESGRIKGDNPPYHRMSSGHSSPRTPITPQFSSEHLMEHHRQHSESDLSASESQQAGSKESGRRRDSGGKEWGPRSHRDDHQLVIIPLGDDTPSKDLIDPRTKQTESEPVFLPLPLFAQYARPIINSPIVEDSPKYDMLKNDSPCFSPPSSGSKNASPQTSPNNDFESGDSQETPQGETSEFVKPLDEPSHEVENETSVISEKETDKPAAEPDSEEYSDSNSELDSPDKLSLEERIRRLDEKLNAAPAPPTTSSKTTDTSSPHTPTISSTFNTAAASQQPSSDLYRKYKIKKKNDSTGTGSGDSKSEPSEIVKTMLSRSSIFDQDTKRLEQINEKYQPRSVSLDVSDSPKMGMVRTKAAAKEMPLSTLPGSLAGRLGNGASSFPTLSVNTAIGGDPNKLDNMSPSESSMTSDSCPVSPSAAAILASQKDNLWLEGGLMPSEYSEDTDIEHSTSTGYNSGLLNTLDSSSDKCNDNSDLTSSKDVIKVEKDVSEDKDESFTEQISSVDNTKNTSKVDTSSSLLTNSNCDRLQEDNKSSIGISKPLNYKDVLSKSDSSNSSAISTSVYSNTDKTDLTLVSTNSDVKSEKSVTTSVQVKSENSEKDSTKLSSKVNSDNSVKSDINNSNIGNLSTGDTCSSESTSTVKSEKLTSEELKSSSDSDKSDNICVESSSDNKDNLMEIDSSDKLPEDQNKTQESLNEDKNSTGLKSDSNLTSLEVSDSTFSEKVDSEPLFSLGKRKADTDDSIQAVIEQNPDATSASKSDSNINTSENKENSGKCSQPEPKKPKISREKSAESQNSETNDKSESSDKNVQPSKEKNSEEKKRDKVEGDSVMKKESSGGQKKDKDKDGNKDKISGSSTSSSTKSSSGKSSEGKHHDKSPTKSSSSSSKSSRDKSPAKAMDNKHHDKSKSGGNSSDSKKDSSSDKKSEHSSSHKHKSSSSSSSKTGDSKTKEKSSSHSSSSSSKGENVDKSQKDDHSQKSSKLSKSSSTDDSAKAQDKSKHSEKSNTADESTSKSTSKSVDKVNKHSDKANTDGHTPSSKSHSSHSEKSSSHSSKSSKDSSKDSDKNKSSSSKLKSSSSIDKGSEHKSKNTQDSEKSKDKDKQTSDTTNTVKQKHSSSSTSSTSDVTKDAKHKSSSSDDQKHKNKHSDDKSSSKQKHKEDGKHKSSDKTQSAEKKTSAEKQSSTESKISTDTTTEKKQSHDISEKKTTSKSTTGDKKLSSEKKTKEKTDSKVTKSESKSVDHKSEKAESKKESTLTTSSDKKSENKTEKSESKSKENKSQQNTDKKQETTTAAKSEEKKSETSDKADNKTDNKKKEKSTKPSTPVKSVKDQKNNKDKGKTKHQEMVESKTKSSHDKTKKQSKEKVSVDSIDSLKDQGKKNEKENDQKKSNKKDKAEKKTEPTAEVEFDWEAWQGPYVSMYDKVKRRSTEKDKEREMETMRKKLDQLQKNRNKRSTVSMSDETNSTDFNTDDDSDEGPASKPVSKSKKEKSKKTDTSQKRKKYVLDTSSSSDEDDDDDDDDTSAFTKSPIGKKPPIKDNALIKTPKSGKKASILDIYSSDSEEEENRNMASETSFDLPTSNKKKPVKKVKESSTSDKLLKKKDDENDKLKKAKQPKKVQEKKVEKTNYLVFSSDNSADDLSDHFDDSDSDINLMKKKSTSKKTDKKATQKAIRKIYSSSSSDEDSGDEKNILQEHKSSVDQIKPKTTMKDTPKKPGKSIFDLDKMPTVKEISHASDSEHTSKTETVLQKMEKEIDTKEEDQKSVDKSNAKHDKTNKKKRKDQKENILLGEGKLEIGKSIGTKKEEGKIGLFEKMETYLRTDISDKSPGKECLLNKFDDKMFSKSTVSSETVNIINDITTESIKAKKHKKEGKKDKKKMDKENAQFDLSSELKNVNLGKDDVKNKINCDIIDSVNSLHNLTSPQDKFTSPNLETDQKDGSKSDIIKSDKSDKKSKKKKKERQISGSSVSSETGKEGGLQSPIHIEPSRQSSIDQSLPSIDDDKVKKSKKVKNDELFGDKSESKMDDHTISESTDKDAAESAKMSDNESLVIETVSSSKSDQTVTGDQEEIVKSKKGKKKKRTKSGSGDSDVSIGKDLVSGEVPNQLDMSAPESSFVGEQTTGGDNQQEDLGKVKKGKKKKKDKSEQDAAKKHKKKDKEKHENEEVKSKKKEKHDNEDGKSKKKEKKKKKKKDLLETQSSSETLSNEHSEDHQLVIDTSIDVPASTSEKVHITGEHKDEIPVENIQTSEQIHESITSSIFQVQTVEIKNSTQVKESETEHKSDKNSKAGDIFEFNEDDDDDETIETKGNWKPLRIEDNDKRKHKLYTSDTDSARKSSNDDSKLFWSSDNETTTKPTETSYHSSIFDNETEKFSVSSESALNSNQKSSNDDHSGNELSTSAVNDEHDVFDNVISDVEVTVSQNDGQPDMDDHVHGLQIAADLQDLDNKLVINTDVPKSDTSLNASKSDHKADHLSSIDEIIESVANNTEQSGQQVTSDSFSDNDHTGGLFDIMSESQGKKGAKKATKPRKRRGKKNSATNELAITPAPNSEDQQSTDQTKTSEIDKSLFDWDKLFPSTTTKIGTETSESTKEKSTEFKSTFEDITKQTTHGIETSSILPPMSTEDSYDLEKEALSMSFETKKPDTEETNTETKDASKQDLILEAVTSLQNLERSTKSLIDVSDADNDGFGEDKLVIDENPTIEDEEEEQTCQQADNETALAIQSILPLDEKTGEFVSPDTSTVAVNNETVDNSAEFSKDEPCNAEIPLVDDHLSSEISPTSVISPRGKTGRSRKTRASKSIDQLNKDNIPVETPTQPDIFTEKEGNQLGMRIDIQAHQKISPDNNGNKSAEPKTRSDLKKELVKQWDEFRAIETLKAGIVPQFSDIPGSDSVINQAGNKKGSRRKRSKGSVTPVRRPQRKSAEIPSEDHLPQYGNEGDRSPQHNESTDLGPYGDINDQEAPGIDDSLESGDSGKMAFGNDNLIDADLSGNLDDADKLSDEASQAEVKRSTRGRKVKNYKEMNSGVLPRTSSPRSRISPRSPRNVTSPKQQQSPPKSEIATPVVKIERLPLVCRNLRMENDMSAESNNKEQLRRGRSASAELRPEDKNTEVSEPPKSMFDLSQIEPVSSANESVNIVKEKEPVYAAAKVMGSTPRDSGNMSKDAANVFDFEGSESEMKLEPVKIKRKTTRRRKPGEQVVYEIARPNFPEKPVENRLEPTKQNTPLLQPTETLDKVGKFPHDSKFASTFQEVATSQETKLPVTQTSPLPVDNPPNLKIDLRLPGEQEKHIVGNIKEKMMENRAKTMANVSSVVTTFSPITPAVPTTPATPMSNIDKIIDNVSKGIFNWTDVDTIQPDKSPMPYFGVEDPAMQLPHNKKRRTPNKSHSEEQHPLGGPLLSPPGQFKTIGSPPISTVQFMPTSVTSQAMTGQSKMPVTSQDPIGEPPTIQTTDYLKKFQKLPETSQPSVVYSSPQTITTTSNHSQGLFSMPTKSETFKGPLKTNAIMKSHQDQMKSTTETSVVMATPNPLLASGPTVLTGSKMDEKSIFKEMQSGKINGPVPVSSDKINVSAPKPGVTSMSYPHISSIGGYDGLYPHAGYSMASHSKGAATTTIQSLTSSQNPPSVTNLVTSEKSSSKYDTVISSVPAAVTTPSLITTVAGSVQTQAVFSSAPTCVVHPITSIGGKGKAEPKTTPVNMSPVPAHISSSEKLSSHVPVSHGNQGPVLVQSHIMPSQETGKDLTVHNQPTATPSTQPMVQPAHSAQAYSNQHLMRIKEAIVQQQAQAKSEKQAKSRYEQAASRQIQQEQQQQQQQRPPSAHSNPHRTTGMQEIPRPSSAHEQFNQHSIQEQIRNQLMHGKGLPQMSAQMWQLQHQMAAARAEEKSKSSQQEYKEGSSGLPHQMSAGLAASASSQGIHSQHPQQIKSPALAQTAPSPVAMVIQSQSSMQRPTSPISKKTTEKPHVGRWADHGIDVRVGGQNDGQRSRPPSRDIPSPHSAQWGFHGTGPSSLSHPSPQPAHQQIDHAAQQREAAARLIQQQQQQQQSLQRQQELFQLQREQREHLKKQQDWKRQQERQDQELKRLAHLNQKTATSQPAASTSSTTTDSRQTAMVQAQQRMASGIPAHVDGKNVMIDPRFAQQHGMAYPPPHGDLRRPSSQTPSAFTPPVTGAPEIGQGIPAHLYNAADLQRLHQAGVIPVRMPPLAIDPHLYQQQYLAHISPHYLSQHAGLAVDHPHLQGDNRPPSQGGGHPSQGSLRSPTGQSQQQLLQQISKSGGHDALSRLQESQMHAVPPRPLPDPPPGERSLLSLLQGYPVMWQGVLALKNDNCVVQMHVIAGLQQLVKMALPQQGEDGTVQPLRIAQRMRLEAAQLDGVAKRMQYEKDFCMLLALPCGRDHDDIIQQTRAMSSGFIQYLQQKQAAGIVNVADQGSQQPAYVVHIFPPCEFSHETLGRLGFELMHHVRDLAHLLVIVTTVA